MEKHIIVETRVVERLPEVGAKLAKFCFVGGSGVFVDMATLFLLATPGMFALPLAVGKIVAGEVAMLNNFVWNELWTFRDRSHEGSKVRNRLFRYLKFNLICSGGILIGVIILKGLVEGLGTNLYGANMLAIIAATGWNFVLNYLFTWRHARV